MRPLVSVLIPVYNARPFLRDSITSILNQTLRDLEVIVIDDGSTDGSTLDLSQLAQSDVRLKVYRQENAGIVSALNHAIRVASGRFLARMDADDVSEVDRLESQLSYLYAHPEVVALGSDCSLIDSAGRSLGSAQFPRDHIALVKAMENRRSAFPHPSVMMPRAPVIKLGGYLERFRHAEDLDLWLRLSQVGRLACLPSAKIRLRTHASNISSFCGGVHQRHAAMLARVCHWRRKMGQSDPSNLPAGEWEAFRSYVKRAMAQNEQDESALTNCLLAELPRNSLARSMVLTWRLLAAAGPLATARLIRNRLFGRQLVMRIAKDAAA